jgi:hypothetical protein
LAMSKKMSNFAIDLKVQRFIYNKE